MALGQDLLEALGAVGYAADTPARGLRTLIAGRNPLTDEPASGEEAMNAILSNFGTRLPENDPNAWELRDLAGPAFEYGLSSATNPLILAGLGAAGYGGHKLLSRLAKAQVENPATLYAGLPLGEGTKKFGGFATHPKVLALVKAAGGEDRAKQVAKLMTAFTKQVEPAYDAGFLKSFKEVPDELRAVAQDPDLFASHIKAMGYGPDEAPAVIRAAHEALPTTHGEKNLSRLIDSIAKQYDVELSRGGAATPTGPRELTKANLAANPTVVKQRPKVQPAPPLIPRPTAKPIEEAASGLPVVQPKATAKRLLNPYEPGNAPVYGEGGGEAPYLRSMGGKTYTISSRGRGAVQPTSDVPEKLEPTSRIYGPESAKAWLERNQPVRQARTPSGKLASPSQVSARGSEEKAAYEAQVQAIRARSRRMNLPGQKDHLGRDLFAEEPERVAALPANAKPLYEDFIKLLGRAAKNENILGAPEGRISDFERWANAVDELPDDAHAFLRAVTLKPGPRTSPPTRDEYLGLIFEILGRGIRRAYTRGKYITAKPATGAAATAAEAGQGAATPARAGTLREKMNARFKRQGGKPVRETPAAGQQEEAYIKGRSQLREALRHALGRQEGARASKDRVRAMIQQSMSSGVTPNDVMDALAELGYENTLGVRKLITENKSGTLFQHLRSKWLDERYA